MQTSPIIANQMSEPDLQSGQEAANIHAAYYLFGTTRSGSFYKPDVMLEHIQLVKKQQEEMKTDIKETKDDVAQLKGGMTVIENQLATMINRGQTTFGLFNLLYYMFKLVLLLLILGLFIFAIEDYIDNIQKVSNAQRQSQEICKDYKDNVLCNPYYETLAAHRCDKSITRTIQRLLKALPLEFAMGVLLGRRS